MLPIKELYPRICMQVRTCSNLQFLNFYVVYPWSLLPTSNSRIWILISSLHWRHLKWESTLDFLMHKRSGSWILLCYILILNHFRTAKQVLAAVQTALKQSSFERVTIVGHSLGAAIALLDSIYLLPFLPGVSIRIIGYGMPRVGNEAFATYVDTHVNITRVNNKWVLCAVESATCVTCDWSLVGKTRYLFFLAVSWDTITLEEKSTYNLMDRGSFVLGRITLTESAPLAKFQTFLLGFGQIMRVCFMSAPYSVLESDSLVT